MVLPLNLAMTSSEIAGVSAVPEDFAWMACHFSPHGQGLTNVPDHLSKGALLILNDSIPCEGHNVQLITETLLETVAKFRCCGLLLDFQRPYVRTAAAVAESLVQALPCPVAAPPEYTSALPCPVFLPPAPLHIRLEDYLRPWQGREIWLEAALCRERITVTKDGASFSSAFDELPSAGSFYNSKLRCRYRIAVSSDAITFTLFDTQDTLREKLELGAALGVTRAVGLYQELG